MTDLQALAEATNSDGNRIFDTNGDGKLNDSDALWGALKIWQDIDQDGETDVGELKTLAEWDISEIKLIYDDGSEYRDNNDDVTIFGNTLHGLASYIRNGNLVEGGVGDVTLAYDATGYRHVETSSGFDVEFQDGTFQHYLELSKLSSANATVPSNTYNGVYGDTRANGIDGSGSTIGLTLDGGDGDDTLKGGHVNDQIFGGDGDDTLRGYDGDDYLVGGAGSDYLSGYSGDDTLVIGAGDIIYNYTDGHAWDIGGSGYDTLILEDDRTANSSNWAAYGIEAVIGNAKDNSFATLDDDIDALFEGAGGNDTLSGAGGDDTLRGGDGDDTLRGYEGDDYLVGGAGSDYLSGYGGDDSLVIGAGDIIYNYADGHAWNIGGSGYV